MAIANWSTEKSFKEVVESLAHLHALEVKTVWLEDGPLDAVTKVKEGNTKYDDVPAGVNLSTVVDGIEFIWSIDIIDHRGSLVGQFDVDVAATLLQRLGGAPRVAFRAILEKWARLFARQVDAQTIHLAKLAHLKDELSELRGEPRSSMDEIIDQLCTKLGKESPTSP